MSNFVSFGKSKKEQELKSDFKTSVPRITLIQGGIEVFSMLEKEVTLRVNPKFKKSYKNKELLFTNFVNKKNCKVQKESLDLFFSDITYIKKKNNKIFFNELKKDDRKRLFDILTYYCEDYDEVKIKEELYKIDLERNSELGIPNKIMKIYLYIRYNVDDKIEYEILFCDLYHLVIPTGHNGKSQKKVQKESYDLARDYQEHIEFLLSSE